jgi:hypothetical protein
MVLAGPRSGTTWAANLLNTDTTQCIHDPLLEYKLVHLDNIFIPNKRVGISCTSMLIYPEWVARHPAKKVILYREPDEINASLKQLGLPLIDPVRYQRRLDALPNIPVRSWKHMFTSGGAAEICDMLGVPFDPWRFHELAKMNVQAEFCRLPIDPAAVKELVARVAEANKS